MKRRPKMCHETRQTKDLEHFQFRSRKTPENDQNLDLKK